MSQSFSPIPSHLAVSSRQRSLLNAQASNSTNASLTNTSSENGDETLNLTIRFSTSSLSDLHLAIPFSSSSTTSSTPTTATLKQHIRASLPSELQNNRLRLIHAGKALDDAVPLATSLKRFVPRAAHGLSAYDSPSGSETDAVAAARSRQKGKAPIRDPPRDSRERIYIHCSIGDVALSEEDLEKEIALASTHAKDDQENTGNLDGSGNAQYVSTTTGTSSQVPTSASVTTPAPRGFDRLLAAGFTASEVHALRLQFVSVQAHTHTPETMPSPTTLRALEDQWLDDSNAAGGGGMSMGLGADGQLGSGGGGFDGSVDDGSGRGALDDMVWGTTMGFFWPIGCVIWGTRETGIFSPRRKIAVVIGLVLNLGLGFVKWGG